MKKPITHNDGLRLAKHIRQELRKAKGLLFLASIESETLREWSNGLTFYPNEKQRNEMAGVLSDILALVNGLKS